MKGMCWGVYLIAIGRGQMAFVVLEATGLTKRAA